MNDIIKKLGNGQLDFATATSEGIKRLGELSFTNPSAISIELLQASLGKAAVDKLSKEITQLSIAQSIDWQHEVDSWLSTYTSDSTRKSYRNAVNKWQQWIMTQGIEPALATPKHADLYASYCRELYKPTTANLYIDAISSLYAMLVKWDKLHRTPFIKVKRAVIQKISKEIPMDSDYCKSNNPVVNSAIDFIIATGCRVGAFATLKITTQGKWTATSKGKIHEGTIDKVLAKKIRKHIPALNDMRVGTLTENIRRTLGYGAHTLRHRFAINLYKSTNHNVEIVRRALGHADIKITTTYLAGLKME